MASRFKSTRQTTSDSKIGCLWGPLFLW
jgi:hypothetical protein